MKLLGKMGLLLGVAGMICFRATSAGALPANEVETDYYSDATFKSQVGSYTMLCTGGHFREGKTSRFSLRFQTPCHDEGGRTEVSCVVDDVQTTCPPAICNSDAFTCRQVTD